MKEVTETTVNLKTPTYTRQRKLHTICDHGFLIGQILILFTVTRENKTFYSKVNIIHEHYRGDVFLLSFYRQNDFIHHRRATSRTEESHRFSDAGQGILAGKGGGFAGTT